MTREKIRKYINCFKESYIIDSKIQPNFWDAVEKLCLNPNSDRKSLGLKENTCCLINYCFYQGNYIPVLNFVPTDTVTEFAVQLANEIIQIDSTPVDPLDYFILKRRYDHINDHSR